MFNVKGNSYLESNFYYYYSLGPPVQKNDREFLEFVYYFSHHINSFIQTSIKIEQESITKCKNIFPRYEREIFYINNLNDQLNNLSLNLSTILFFLRDHFKTFFGSKNIDLYARDLLSISVTELIDVSEFEEGMYSIHFHKDLMDCINEFINKKNLSHLSQRCLSFEDVLCILFA